MKVRIQMDESFVFYMDDHSDPVYPSTDKDGATFEVPNELYDKYIKAFRAFYDMNSQIEQLYRIQLGKQPWSHTAIPEHKVINDHPKKT